MRILHAREIAHAEDNAHAKDNMHAKEMMHAKVELVNDACRMHNEKACLQFVLSCEQTPHVARGLKDK